MDNQKVCRCHQDYVKKFSFSFSKRNIQSESKACTQRESVLTLCNFLEAEEFIFLHWVQGKEIGTHICSIESSKLYNDLFIVFT